jgi:16S rRNA processing protein RimM
VEAGYRLVARFSKPHGLKGEAIVFVLTDRPALVFVPGAALTPVDDTGQPTGPPLTIERARAYHRRWLLKFREIEERTPLESWRLVGLGVPASALPPPPVGEDGSLTADELAGATVTAAGRPIGTARGLIPVPGGELLVIEYQGREVLIPFRAPIVERVDRAEREIAIAPPPGLLEL